MPFLHRALVLTAARVNPCGDGVHRHLTNPSAVRALQCPKLTNSDVKVRVGWLLCNHRRPRHPSRVLRYWVRPKGWTQMCLKPRRGGGATLYTGWFIRGTTLAARKADLQELLVCLWDEYGEAPNLAGGALEIQQDLRVLRGN